MININYLIILSKFQISLIKVSGLVFHLF